jgi:hypothetical protein
MPATIGLGRGPITRLSCARSKTHIQKADALLIPDLTGLFCRVMDVLTRVVNAMQAGTKFAFALARDSTMGSLRGSAAGPETGCRTS